MLVQDRRPVPQALQCVGLNLSELCRVAMHGKSPISNDHALGPGNMKKISQLETERDEGHGGLWSVAARPLSFPFGRVDVWRLCLDEPSKAEGNAGVLSPDEMDRASRFHFERDRTRFVRCRSALRCLLAGYLGATAAEIRFEYLASGKPQIAPEDNPRGLHFNVSHSADMALIAVGSALRLGVDIEKIRDDVDAAALAERFFSPRERAGLRALPAHLLVPGFFACWTRKEAFLKATGTGLSFPLAEFSVSTHPDVAPELEDLQGDREAGKRWFLTDLRVENACRATLALDRRSRIATLEMTG
jgi:4'-phosphopantetheinyl transferase